jgi:hypothetical protein
VFNSFIYIFCLELLIQFSLLSSSISLSPSFQSLLLSAITCLPSFADIRLQILCTKLAYLASAGSPSLLLAIRTKLDEISRDKTLSDAFVMMEREDLDIV